MPMIEKVEAGLNAQIDAEFTSSFLYLSLAAYYHSLNLDGFAAYMRIQAEDERSHGMKLFDLLDARGGRVLVSGIPKPPTHWESPRAGIEDVVKWEVTNTERINNLIKIAHDHGDFATVLSLQDLVIEQVRDEATAHELLHKMQLLEQAPGGLFLMDRELRTRAQRG
jgi:ferritin